jgi:hypothetical protein
MVAARLLAVGLNRPCLLTASLLVAACLTALTPPVNAQTTWRSALYPSNWTPGYKDAQGRFLHDFGYAGYRRGEAPIPSGPPNGATLVVNAVTQYGADNTGATDTTVALQSALDAVGSAGGGVVFLPAGVYKIQPQGSNVYSLWMKYSNVVLRGAGTEQTFLYNAATYMRSKETIRILPSAGGNWTSPASGSPTAFLTQDYNDPTRSLKVDNRPAP